MNVERLLHLIHVLESIPKSAFDIDHWQNKKPCGTTACAVGWAASDPEFQKQGLTLGGEGFSAKPEFEGRNNWYAVDKFFDIDADTSAHLFHPDCYVIDGESIATPQLVIQRIGGVLGHHAKFYFIVDDFVTDLNCEGFEVLHGNPWTATGTKEFSAKTRRECEAFINKRTAKGERVYRVFLARRHHNHRVTRI